jgi:hypothetical protein
MIRIAILTSCLLAVGCQRFAGYYDREYVLYDGSLDRDRAEPVEATAVDRIFALEDELGELDRAIRDGLDTDGALRRRRAEIEEEVLALKGENGEAYRSARAERLRKLAGPDR